MCITVYCDGRVYGNAGELRKLIQPAQIVWRSGYDKDLLDDQSCLCPVNLGRTAKAAGFKRVPWRPGDEWRDSMEDRWERIA